MDKRFSCNIAAVSREEQELLHQKRITIVGCGGAAGIWLIHGAVSGWKFQTMAVSPGSGRLRAYYKRNRIAPGRSCLSFTAAVGAGMQFAQGLKLLLGKPGGTDERMLAGDLETGEFQVTDAADIATPDKTITIRMRNAVNGYRNDNEEISAYATVNTIALSHSITHFYVMLNGELLDLDKYDDPLFEDGDEVTYLML
ncbi:MAG: hypothetical protein IJH75_03360 [Mogibacterium sp.]|nr:hypothetical protein [Mogibacterium sp.]